MSLGSLGSFGDDLARMGDDAAHVAADAPKFQLPAGYAFEQLAAKLADDVSLVAEPGAFHPASLTDELDNAIWLDTIKLSDEGVVRFGRTGPRGVLDDPVRFTTNHDWADLSSYPELQRRFQPHAAALEESMAWRGFDELGMPGSTTRFEYGSHDPFIAGAYTDDLLDF